MKNLEQIKQAVLSNEIDSAFPDGRNVERLLDYFPVSEWEAMGFKPIEGTDISTIKVHELTEDSVKERLQRDVAFAFDKAMNKRGISSAAMYSVVKTWLWVLEDPLFASEDYAQYGLPLFKAVALKYGFPNPIGKDAGNEFEYSMEAD